MMVLPRADGSLAAGAEQLIIALTYDRNRKPLFRSAGASRRHETWMPGAAGYPAERLHGTHIILQQRR
jgi:hypothetical protein